jgi:metallo-beta-lactamase class B
VELAGRHREAGIVKRWYTLALIALVGPAAWGGPARLSFRHLSGPLYLATDAEYFPTNWLVYVGPKTVTVVGATWTPAMARTLSMRIRQVTRVPITAVIDTSPDPEWSGGNAYWKDIGAKIFAVRITDELLQDTWTQRDRRARKNHPGYPILPLVAPTEVVPNQFALQHGNLRAFYLGPTHTPGDIFVYFPREQVLDAGSILKPYLGNMANADVREYPKTLRRLQRMHLKIRIVVAGHWSAVQGPDLIEKYLGMLKLYVRNHQQ